jgi:hypothetical protein
MAERRRERLMAGDPITLIGVLASVMLGLRVSPDLDEGGGQRHG